MHSATRDQVHFIPALPHWRLVQGKTQDRRLSSHNLFPYLFKCVISNSDPNISIKASVRQTRSNTNNGILLNVAKCRTVSYQTSFYIRSAKVWNNLPCCIRDISKSLASFKRALFMYYKDLTETIYDPDDPRSFKTVCVKCHASRPLTNLSKRLCC